MNLERSVGVGSVLRQIADYDCAHVCLLHQGFNPPAIDQPLTADNIISHLGADRCSFQPLFTDNYSFRERGIYYISGPGLGHWVSFLRGMVLDPYDGAVLQPDDLIQRYEKYGSITWYVSIVD